MIYALTIGKLISPKAMKYISKISNTQICAYPDKKETMTHLTCINQLSSTVNIRPMLTQAQRIIFSNVTPVIPNSKFENIFKVNNVKLCSKISTFKAGVTDSEYAHCFRRQVFINPDDTKKIPSTFLLIFKDTNYRIFTSTDSLHCFFCKQESHLAKDCLQNQVPSTLIDSTNLTIE
ncbi:hypothetical protein K0M31_016525 [Melipona bicolor]|uniref:CCHC-type domain-containing protein n=1 Tax=Melipona bicolor TaxID=60889 RepID=A0AA40FEE8_9HYME|nr:hypothetical protein K0M31_016525 [Melipona bicolor]